MWCDRVAVEKLPFFALWTSTMLFDTSSFEPEVNLFFARPKNDRYRPPAKLVRQSTLKLLRALDRRATFGFSCALGGYVTRVR